MHRRNQERGKAVASTEDPNLHEVLGEIASSQHPIVEGDIFRVFQSILKEKHEVLRVLQAKKTRTNFTEEETHQLSIKEYPLEADKLQIRQEGIQLGCLLVQKN